MNEDSFMYKFLMSPRYRIGRHGVILFIVLILVITNVISVYRDFFDIIGKGIYPILLILLLFFLIFGYFNLYFLIPRFLLKRKYFSYITLLLITIFAFLFSVVLQEWVVHRWFNLVPARASYLHEKYFAIINFSSEVLLLAMAQLGLGFAVMLKYWIRESQQVRDLEQLHIRNEVEQLKEQANPGFLYNILHHTGRIAAEEPDKASEMLLYLSRLLRYQLYDGNQEKILLSAEIQYLVNYLKLENLYSGKISFDSKMEGESNRSFIPPLLLLPFVRYAVREVYEKKQNRHILLRTHTFDSKFLFAINTFNPNPFREKEFVKLRQRLEFLFGAGYDLSINSYPGEKGNFIILTLER